MSYDANKSRLDDAIKSATKLYETIQQQAKEIEKIKQTFGVLLPYREDVAYAKWNADDAAKYNPASWQLVLEESRPVCEANEKALAANLLLIDKLKSVIEGAGLKTHTVQRKGRSSWKTESVDADWVKSLRGAISYPKYTTRSLNEFAERVEKLRQEKRKLREAEERRRTQQQEAIERDRKNSLAIVDVARAIGIDPMTTDLESLQEVLRERDKYLNLAVAMEETRGDWSDGFYRVESALSSFRTKANCDLDNSIIACVAPLLDDPEDGRVFRDCKYSYRDIYGYVDGEVLAMWSKLRP